MKNLNVYLAFVLSVFLVSCNSNRNNDSESGKDLSGGLNEKIAAYEEIELSVDLGDLDKKQKELVATLIDVSIIMDDIFWTQSYGSKEKLFNSIKDEDSILFVKYNYGPWDRLNGMKPFVEQCGLRPPGARFYPSLIDLNSFEKINDDSKYSKFTLIRKEKGGGLRVVPYAQAYEKQNERAAKMLYEAAKLSDNPQFGMYLNSLAEGFMNDDFEYTFREWLKLKENRIDFIAGPIDPYEDLFLSTKTAHVAMLLLRDKNWSKKLEKFASSLPELQKELPVPEDYKKEIPVMNSELGVYDVLFVAGSYNTGGKKIALNLPHLGCNDCDVNSRKLQLRNVMKAKFEKILKPIGEIVLDDAQVKNINFDAFFENTMFYEVGNLLGPKTTIRNKGKVSNALKEYHFVFEELKSDALSLFLITKLYKTDIFSEKDILDNYVTYMADIFRSIRFGATNPQAKANTIRFYYFEETGAFTKDTKSGKYKVNLEKMVESITQLAEKVIVIQGNGDYSAAKEMVRKYGQIKADLTQDLSKINEKGIPKDLVFKQGKSVLGL